MPLSQPDGYLATPPASPAGTRAGGQSGGVLVLHAWWGLNDTIKDLCRRLSESGLVAFAPDLYHGKVADDIPGAKALSNALDSDQACAEVAKAAAFLDERAGQPGRGLAVIGLSLGAYMALDLSETHPEHVRSVVVFYGTGPTEFSRSRAAYLGHFAESDEFEPKSSVDELEEALRRAGRPVTFHHYAGTGHWFFEPDRAQVYNPAAANLAWDRTLAFLRSS